MAVPKETGPKISVLIPSYNQAAFIEETLESVITQDYDNWEIVVMDGGSTDGTVEVLKRYDSVIGYWESTPDGGQSAALNKAIEKATGDLIGWQNSDDYYLPGAFAACAEAAKRRPEIDVFHGVTYRMPQDTRIILDKLSIPADDQIYEVFPETCTCNASLLIRRGLFERGLRWNEGRRYAMDAELLKDLICMKARFGFVEGLQAIYRLHADAKAPLAGSKSHLELLAIAMDMLADRGMSSLWPSALRTAKRELIAIYRSLEMRLFTKEYENCLQAHPMKFLDLQLGLRYLKALAMIAFHPPHRG